MKTIIVDTNAWMSMIEFKMDLFTALDQICDFSYKVAVLEGTLQELKKIQENQKGKEKLTAKLVLDIIKKKNIESMFLEIFSSMLKKESLFRKLLKLSRILGLKKPYNDTSIS